LSDASEVITVSGALRADLRRYAPDRKIHVIPNLVDTDYFTLPETPPEQKPFRFLTVASLKPVKGVDLLIQAFHRAFLEREDVVLEIAGEGPERCNLENLVRDLKISDHVCFSGLLTREQVRKCMWRSNVFVLASHVETFGVVLAEALATGLPVIATKCGGPEDFVDKETGFLVEPGNVSALAQALKQAWAERIRFNKCRLREYAGQKFSPAVVSRQICAIYRRVRCNQG
jgi:glycosyltransferase involved in cell wall biosynthesis